MSALRVRTFKSFFFPFKFSCVVVCPLLMAEAPALPLPLPIPIPSIDTHTHIRTNRKPATLSCGQCAGFFYCTRAHQVAHWTSLGHHAECGRIARQCARADDLRREDDLQWLSWARRATLDVDEGRETRCTVLRHLGVHGVDQFRRECACYAKTPFGMMTTTMTDATAGDEDDEDSLFTTSVTRRGGAAAAVKE